MRKKQREQTTVIAPGAAIEGELRVSGDVHVEGRVNGSVHVDGCLSVGPEGSLMGEVYCQDATVAGVVDGILRASGHLSVLPGGSVGVDVIYDSLEIQKGGQIQGQARSADTGTESRASTRDADAVNGKVRSIRPVPMGEA